MLGDFLTKRGTGLHDSASMIHEHLPAGVTRSSDLQSFVTLENCMALRFSFPSTCGGTNASVIVWKDLPSAVEPISRAAKLRDLRPGDMVRVFGEPTQLLGVEIYR